MQSLMLFFLSRAAIQLMLSSLKAIILPFILHLRLAVAMLALKQMHQSAITVN
jgi:hypothetical protein